MVVPKQVQCHSQELLSHWEETGIPRGNNVSNGSIFYQDHRSGPSSSQRALSFHSPCQTKDFLPSSGNGSTASEQSPLSLALWNNAY